jgi:hypothetical protein
VTFVLSDGKDTGPIDVRQRYAKERSSTARDHVMV